MRKLYLILSILLLFSCKGKSQELKKDNSDCVFDNNRINDDFLKENPNIYSYKWDDSLKKASVILKDGELLNIKQWACVHYSINSEMLIYVGYEDLKDKWKSYFINIVDIIGDKAITQLVADKLKENIFLNDSEVNLIEIHIPNEWYLEFYLTIKETSNDGYVFSLSYYNN